MATTDLQKLAFRYHVLHALVIADRQLDPDEMRVYERILPEMQAAGLMDEHREPTAAYLPARAEALTQLADALSDDDKKALMAEFRELARSDHDLADTERSIFDAAAGVLGLDLEVAWQVLRG